MLPGRLNFLENGTVYIRKEEIKVDKGSLHSSLTVQFWTCTREFRLIFESLDFHKYSMRSIIYDYFTKKAV